MNACDTTPTPALPSRLNRLLLLVAAVICIGSLIFFSVLRTSQNAATPKSIHSTDSLDLPLSNAHLRPTIASRERMLEITAGNNDLVYLPSSNMLFMTVAKGGSTSTWHWLFRGHVGRTFKQTKCKTYIQNIRCSCWGDEAVHLHRLSSDEQWRILTSDETLRVAVQRNPFERIVSGFKSKFTCQGDVYGTDIKDRARMVSQLRRQAGLPEGAECMNISEFAEALAAVREKAGAPGHRLKSLSKMNAHVRPQQFFFDEIDYDIVLDVRDLSNVKYLQPIIERMKYRDLVKDGIEHRHASKGQGLMIPESAARLLYLFATESKLSKSKHYTGGL